MLSSTLQAVLALALAATAPTHALPADAHLRRPLTTNATYWIEGACGDEGSYQVSSGNVTTLICQTFYTYAMDIQPIAGRNCSYEVWNGSKDCGVTIGGDVAEGKRSLLTTSTVELGKGIAPVCVVSGVYDGGAHTYVSGMLRCK